MEGENREYKKKKERNRPTTLAKLSVKWITKNTIAEKTDSREQQKWKTRIRNNIQLIIWENL